MKCFQQSLGNNVISKIFTSSALFHSSFLVALEKYLSSPWLVKYFILVDKPEQVWTTYKYKDYVLLT